MTKRTGSSNGYKIAVSLAYDEAAEAAPSVAAKGTGLMADEVVRIAQRFNVPVIEKDDLARSLDALEVDQRIPPSLFEAVAIVLNQLKKKIASIARAN